MKQCFFSKNGPKAVGPYATAVVYNGTAYLSGVIPIVPATGKLAEGGIGEQTRQAIANIRTVLEEMGFSMLDVLKTTVYLTDLKNFGAVNEIYAAAFGPDYPARSCVEISALPMGALVEIECTVAAEA